MKILNKKRCVIGEGPIWNEKEHMLYFTNGMGKEICKYNPKTEEISLVPLEKGCAAFAFDKENRLIVSRPDGVFILHDNGSITDLYDPSKYKIENANDMKVGPDGRIYVGTQSGKRRGISDKTDGKLYSIDKFGNVRIFLDGLLLSNGMEWSIDEKLFYHTDSDTGLLKEYAFDRVTGGISFTGRQLKIPGIDGFTIDNENNLYVACWGQGHVAVVDTRTMQVREYIEVPCKIPASCGFMGEDMRTLAITTASYGADIRTDKNAGFTLLLERETGGRMPYLFG